MTKLIQIETVESIYKLSKLASTIWNEYFPAIIGQDQVDYMVDKFQSIDAISIQIEEDYLYFFVSHENEVIGYIGLVPRDDKDAMQISKFYLLKDWRGRGIATATMDEVNNIAVNQGYNKLYLTVNIYNNSAISIYEKLEFINIGNLVTDIGGGYIMDDYEMEKMIDN